MDKPNASSPPPLSKEQFGLIIFAALMILGSVYKLIGLLNFDYYIFMFQDLPKNTILFRYIISLMWRFVAMAVAFGLLKRSPLAHRMVLLIAVLALVSVPWRHPYSVFHHIAIYTEQQQGINTFPQGTFQEEGYYPLYPPSAGNHPLAFPYFPSISLIFYAAVDVLFAAALLIFFTRKSVVELFKPRRPL